MRLIDELNVQADGFIFDEKRGEMFTVNATGMLIIKAIQAEKSLKRISE